MGVAGIAAASPVAVGLLAPTQALADQFGDAYGPHMMWGEGWYGMVFGPLMMVLVLAAAIAVVVLLVRWLGGSGHAGAPQHPAPAGRAPLDILKERFARGEIDKAEFEERRRVLGE
jgi:putative membrane protein